MYTCYMYDVVQTWLVRQLINLIQTPVSFCSWYTRTNTRSSPTNPNTAHRTLGPTCVVFATDSKTRPKTSRKYCSHYFFIPRTGSNYSWKWQKGKKSIFVLVNPHNGFFAKPLVEKKSGTGIEDKALWMFKALSSSTYTSFIFLIHTMQI